MDVAAIRQGLATLLANIDDPTNPSEKINSDSKQPDTIRTPLAYVKLPTGNMDVVRYDAAMDGGSHYLNLIVTLLMDKWDPERAQDYLDPYIGNGASSIYAAVNSDPKLGQGAAVLDAVVKRAWQYGIHEVNGLQWLGCNFLVEVLVNS